MKNMYVPGLFDKPSLFTKNKLEENSIQRQSLQDLLSFRILEKLWIAPKFSQNSFFQRPHINKTGLFVAYHFITTCLSNTNKQSTSKCGCKKHKDKH